MHKWEQLQSGEQTKEFALDLLLFSPFTDCLCLLRAFVCATLRVCLCVCECVYLCVCLVEMQLKSFVLVE